MLQLTSFATFMYLIPFKYRQSFWSMQTSSQFCCEKYGEGEKEDQVKIGVFTNHISLFDPISEHIKSWLNERLSVWLEEEPE